MLSGSVYWISRRITRNKVGGSCWCCWRAWLNQSVACLIHDASTSSRRRYVSPRWCRRYCTWPVSTSFDTFYHRLDRTEPPCGVTIKHWTDSSTACQRSVQRRTERYDETAGAVYDYEYLRQIQSYCNFRYPT